MIADGLITILIVMIALQIIVALGFAVCTGLMAGFHKVVRLTQKALNAPPGAWKRFVRRLLTRR